ncbi:MAG TPA: hypothetical protein VGE74_28260 [Gemmata sp.]
MAHSSGEIDIPVFGHVTMCPPGVPASERQLVAETPGPFRPAPGVAYDFEFMGIPDVRDPDLEQLVDALAAPGGRAITGLALGGAPVTARSVRWLVELPWLESLDAYRMTDEGLGAVSRLPALRRLRLETSDVTDRGAVKLAALAQLEELSLDHCTAVTDRGVAKIATLPKLRDLGLKYCSISDAGVERLADLPALASVDLNGCAALTDRAAEVLASIPTLHTVSMVGCWRLTDRGLGALAGMPKLVYVGVSRCGGFWLRAARKLGWRGDPEVGSFSEGAMQRLMDAHPTCDFWQPIDFAALGN